MTYDKYRNRFKKVMDRLVYVNMEQPCCKVESLPNLKKQGGGAMNTYEILSLLFFGGNFLVALRSYLLGGFTYIDRNNKHK